MSRLAFEIGCEEIPARFLPGALNSLSQAAVEMFRELRLSVGEVHVHGTPRRLILLAWDVAPQQEDEIEMHRGPSAQIAFDSEGRPTKAAHGFARGQGVKVEDLEIHDTPQGRYVFARKVEKGRPARDVLPAALAQLIGKLEFPQSMRWGDGKGVRFIRPIRWLLALLDGEVLPVVYGELTADRLTRGHRSLAPGPHPVAHANELLAVLERSYVLADVTARRDKIARAVQAAAASVGGEPFFDEDFLTEVTHLVEWPTAFVGSFAPEYLELPAELLVLTMKTHQRYFPVKNPAGELLPYFVAVRNGGEEGLDLVRSGNEKVLRARLADARFFYVEDRREPLEAYVPRLAKVTFLERLGSLLDKTHRLERLVGWLAHELGVTDPGERSYALRAAYLAKADQVTRVVYELPELEGIMGREYARLSGEPEAVAQALYEQYLPRPGADELPATTAGQLLAVADRLDTLAGSFAAGLEPTGSQDPYGLRRHATALLSLCRHLDLELSLNAAFAEALAAYGALLGSPDGAGGSGNGAYTDIVERLKSFCRTRLAVQLRDAGFRSDLVDAVMAVGWDTVPDVWARITAANRLLESDVFDDVYTAFRRPYQLSRDCQDTQVDPEQLVLDAETQLYSVFNGIFVDAQNLLQQRRYDEFFRLVARLRRPIDRFFDDVMVMVEDEALRRNRLALLRRIVDLIGIPLDFSRLSV